MPSRIVTTANTAFAYCGHVVIEAFYSNAWGVADTTSGLAFEYGGRPASLWDIQQKPGIVNAEFEKAFGQVHDFFLKGEQYSTAAVTNYSCMDFDSYDYTVSRLNAYDRKVLEHSAQGWGGKPRWLFGEDH